MYYQSRAGILFHLVECSICGREFEPLYAPWEKYCDECSIELNEVDDDSMDEEQYI